MSKGQELEAFVWGLGLGILVPVTQHLCAKSWEQAAVQAGVGEYSPQSAKFQWKKSPAPW